MEQLYFQIIKIVAIVLTLGLPLWSFWMIRKHWIKKDPGEKYRHPETLMPRPFLFGALGVILMPILGIIVLVEQYKGTILLDECVLLLSIGFVISVFFVLYGTRWILIYDSNKLRYRPVIGRIRTYDYSEVRSMTPIAFDLLVHVGRRWILIDMLQDWHPLWDKYHYWRIRNGLLVKKKEHKTALGREFGDIPGGISMLVTIIVAAIIPAVGFLAGMVYCFIDGEIVAAVFCLTLAIICIANLILMLIAAAKPDKYPRLAKVMLGNKTTWGQPRKTTKHKLNDKKEDDTKES